MQAGYNATAQLTRLGASLSDGLLGYITLGINPSASYKFASTSYYTGDDWLPASDVQAESKVDEEIDIYSEFPRVCNLVLLLRMFNPHVRCFFLLLAIAIAFVILYF